MKTHYIILLIVCFVSACSSSKKTQSETASEDWKTYAQTLAKDTFLLPEIPDTMTESNERALFLCMHYWDRFDFTNEKLIDRPDITEQAFVDYINVLSYVPENDAKTSLGITIEKASANKAMLQHFASLFEKYYYGPHSPFRNEDMYLEVLRQLVKSPVLEKEKKSIYEFQLEMIQKNQVGSKANNFDYTIASGKTTDLYSLQSDYLILIFINPGCNTCKAAINSILTNSNIQSALRRNNANRTFLSIMTMYPGDSYSEWAEYLNELPAEWINAYDKNGTIFKKRLYDIQATPVIYLLDKSKKVILKDASVEELSRFFSLDR